MGNRFNIEPTPISGMFTVQRHPMGDARGAFQRLYCVTDMEALGFAWPIRQINHSFTAAKATLRGMHFQRPPHGEVKYITCLKGCVYDVAVDLRKDSATFLQWHAVELDAAKPQSVVLPPGVAHGFQTLTNDVELLYMHSHDHTPEAEGGVNPFDQRLGIEWPLPPGEMSARDKAYAPIQPNFEGLPA